MTAALRLSLLAIFACGFAGAGSSLAQSLDARLLADARDGRLEQLDFLAASLIASGVSDPAEFAAAQSQYERLRQAVDPQSLQQLPPAQRLRELHARMHAEV